MILLNASTQNKRDGRISVIFRINIQVVTFKGELKQKQALAFIS